MLEGKFEKVKAPFRPTVPESQIQASIVQALTMAGFHVKTTSAPLQRGKSGVTKGVPDLLVCHPALPQVYIGMEVKTPKGSIKPEQQAAANRNEYRIVRSVEDALCHAVAVVTELAPTARLDCAMRMIRALRVEPL